MERYELARQGLVVNNTTGPFCFYADAQATIEALQAKLEDLTAKYQNLVAWYDKQNGTPCEQVRHRQEVEALQADNRTYINERHENMKQIEQLQARVQELEQWVQDQSAANLETMRHTDEMQSRALEAEQQLTQRTAECEALQVDNRTYINERHENMKQIEQLQADLAQRTAELEAARGERDRALELRDRWQAQLDKEQADSFMRNIELVKLRALILALPKVEGEIEVICHERNGVLWWDIVELRTDGNAVLHLTTRQDGADKFAALLQHRQGME